MKPETLHALLMDRAYGELTPETEELLDAYLCHEPEAAREAHRMRETLLLARRASAVVRERDALPAPLWLSAVRREEQQRSPWRSLSWLAYAACIAGGVLIGPAISTMWQKPATRPPQVAMSVLPQMQEGLEKGGGTRFWSSANPMIEKHVAGSRVVNRAVLHTDAADVREGFWRRNK